MILADGGKLRSPPVGSGSLEPARAFPLFIFKSLNFPHVRLFFGSKDGKVQLEGKRTHLFLIWLNDENFFFFFAKMHW